MKHPIKNNQNAVGHSHDCQPVADCGSTWQIEIEAGILRPTFRHLIGGVFAL